MGLGSMGKSDIQGGHADLTLSHRVGADQALLPLVPGQQPRSCHWNRPRLEPYPQCDLQIDCRSHDSDQRVVGLGLVVSQAIPVKSTQLTSL